MTCHYSGLLRSLPNNTVIPMAWIYMLQGKMLQKEIQVVIPSISFSSSCTYLLTSWMALRLLPINCASIFFVLCVFGIGSWGLTEMWISYINDIIKDLSYSFLVFKSGKNLTNARYNIILLKRYRKIK